MSKNSLDDENETVYINLIKILTYIWKGKYFIAFCFILFVFLGFVYLKNTDYLYTVSMKIVPSEQSQKTNLGSSGNLQSFASFVGIGNTNAPVKDNYNLYQSLLTSRIVADILFEDQEFMLNVFKDRWDDENQTWITPTRNLKGKVIDRIKLILGLPVYPLKPLSSRDVQEFIKSSINIQLLDDYELTGIVYISAEVTNKDHGVLLLKKLHKITNEYIKSKDLIRIENYLKFTTNQLSKTNNQDVRLALVGTLNQHLKKKVLTSVDFDYAAETLGRIIPSDYPTKPRLSLVLMVFALLGITFGVLGSFIFYFFDENKK